MKKCFILSLLAAWAFGAQAGDSIKYWVSLKRIDGERVAEEKRGTLPGEVMMTLVDAGNPENPNRIIYSQRINFSNDITVYNQDGDEVVIGGSKYIREDGRFDIASLVADCDGLAWAELKNPSSAISNSEITFKMDESAFKWGVCAELEGVLESLNVYENCQGMTDAEKIAYANKNLKTVFEVDNEGTFELAVDAADNVNKLNSSNELGALKPIAVPEPTSGLLFLMGLAGLALKRKRAK